MQRANADADTYNKDYERALKELDEISPDVSIEDYLAIYRNEHNKYQKRVLHNRKLHLFLNDTVLIFFSIAALIIAALLFK